jgi:hypothetical protein
MAPAPSPSRASVLWAFQAGLSIDDAPARFIPVLDAHGIPWCEVPVRPFERTAPEIGAEHDGPVILYGSTAMSDRSVGGPLVPGVWYEPERFAWGAVHAGYGEALLNVGCRVCTIAEFLAEGGDQEEAIFLRVADDSKRVPGAVNARWGWRRKLRQYLGWENGPVPETLLQVARPCEIEAEYRTFVARGSVIAASSHRQGGRYDVDAPVPEWVTGFAGEMARRYAPAPVFVLDVADTPDGPRVVEVGCANCAGIYGCNPEAIVLALTDEAAREYAGRQGG